jgi:hypothetical protein
LRGATAGATVSGYGPYEGLTTSPGTKTVTAPHTAFPNGLGPHPPRPVQCQGHPPGPRPPWPWLNPPPCNEVRIITAWMGGAWVRACTRGGTYAAAVHVGLNTIVQFATCVGGAMLRKDIFCMCVHIAVWLADSWLMAVAAAA